VIRAFVVLAIVLAILAGGATAHAERTRTLAGSIQLDYLHTTDPRARETTLDGATVELSLKLAVDFSRSTSANVKVCFACHGFEAGAAYVELRAADGLRLRAGRLTPSFGAFPARHDPANHETSDKPLPYDMGRMLQLREWNEGILPAPWVDNGVELVGTYFAAHGRIDYAAYVVSGPKGPPDAVDFDFIQSRSPQAYYVDNNGQPSAGARLAGTLELHQRASVALGVSGMAGRYDPAAKLGFAIAGADLAVTLHRTVLRAEYLIRWTQMALGESPSARFKYGAGPDGFTDYFVKDGFYAELEQQLGRLTAILRWDGLRRGGNVIATSKLRSQSALLRYTAGAALRISGGLRIKASVERYDFSDFSDATAVHLGVATAF
jgi:hypothetical protein